MEIFNDFLTHFFGGSQSAGWYLAALAWSIIGQLISLRVGINKPAAIANPETPRKFSLWFAIQDNLVRLVTGVAIAFIAIRFSQELMGVEPTLYLAIVYGFSTDLAVKALSKLQEAARF